MSWAVQTHTAIQEFISSGGHVPRIQSVVPPRLEQSAIFVIIWKKIPIRIILFYLI